MSLLSNEMEQVVLMERKRTPDGVGGFATSWVEGAQFKAAITYDDSMEARIGEKQGVTNRYTVLSILNAKLEYHDVIKRLSDGKIFRITSDGDDSHTPSVASFQVSKVSAEEWMLQ